jgi:drug/metabolite transporter (DMT)-like permease
MNGPLMMFLSAVFFSIMSVLVNIAGHSISAAEITFIRSAITTFILIGILFFNKSSVKVNRMDKLVFRGIVGGISLVLFIYALTLTKVANALLLDYTQTIFAAIFAVIYLNERMTKEKIFFLVMAFVGLLIVFHFDISAVNIGDLLALAAGFVSGLAIVAIRDLRKTDNSIMITMSFSLAGLFFSLLLLKGNTVIPTSHETIILIAIGIFGTLGQLFMTYAYKLCSAALGSVISMSAIVMAALIGIPVLHEPLTYSLIVGGLLIIASAVFFSMEESSPAK